MKNQKTILIVVIVLVVILALVLILKASLTTSNPTVSNPTANTQATTGIKPQAVINSDGKIINPITDVVTPGEENAPSLYQGNSVELKPQTIVVGETGFTPRTVNATVGSKINIVFESSDDTEHNAVFTDKALSFIDLKFSKADGNKTITFPAPAAGNYSFYIDKTSNTGTLIVK